MVFEHGVKAQEGDVVAKILLDPLGLRQPVGYAAGTEHLKRLDYHDLTPEIGQGRIVGSVEPASDGQFRGQCCSSIAWSRWFNSFRAPQLRGDAKRARRCWPEFQVEVSSQETCAMAPTRFDGAADADAQWAALLRASSSAFHYAGSGVSPPVPGRKSVDVVTCSFLPGGKGVQTLHPRMVSWSAD